MSTPKYQHDCDACHHLGHSKDGLADLYYCGESYFANHFTLIARFSDDGPDYLSGREFYGDVEYITEAGDLAFAQGHVSAEQLVRRQTCR